MHYETLDHFISFHVHIVSVLIGHFVNHMIAVYSMKHHHDASKMTLRKCLYNEIWPSYGPLCIDMQRKKIEEIVLLHLQSTD